jgi:hypothetical protein
MSIKVNMSDQEAKSGEGGFGLPSGLYDCIITEVEGAQSQSDANPGKPLLKFTADVQSGEHADSQIKWTACCWPGALYTIVGLLKALDMYEDANSGVDGLDIPDAPEAYIGKRLMVRRGVNKKSKAKNPEDDPASWIEVRGFAPYKEGEASTPGGQRKAAAAGGILP